MWKTTLKALIDSGKYGTQSELVGALADAGFDVNQGSVSRYLKTTGVKKTNGVYVGTQSSVGAMPVHSMRVTSSGCLAVLKTDPAYAPMLGQLIDYAYLEGVLGTVAGDDTVFVALEEPHHATIVSAFLGLA
jgi:transcriptional regulator of arginine metabolism